MDIHHEDFAARRELTPAAADERLTTSSALDFHAIWAAIYRSRYLIGIVIATCLGAGLLISLLLTPRFQAAASVQIDSEAAKVLGTEQGDPTSQPQDSERFLRTQVDVIQSRAMADRVASALKLYNNTAFLDAMGAKPTEGFPNMSERESRREQILGLLQKNLSVSLPPDSRIVDVTFRSRSPVLAAQVSNSFAQNYVRLNLQRKFDNSSYARSFLAEQLQAAQARLEQAERAVVDYARNARIVDTSNAAGNSGAAGATAGGSLNSATLVQLNNQLSEATARRIDAQGQWDRARDASTMTLTEVLSNNAIQQLIQNRAELQAQYQDELQRRKADFPTVLQLKARIDELNGQINQLANNIRNSIRLRYETALSQEQSLNARVNGLKSSSFVEQNQNVQLSILKRGADTYRTQYEYLLRRYNELSSEAGVQANNVSVVDLAPVPIAPFFPNVPLNLLLALIAGMGLSAVLVFGRERLFEAVRTPQDVADNLGISLLGVVPELPDPDDMMAELNDPKTGVSEAFSSVRTALSLAGADGLPKSLAFTSTQQGEGKSTACLATGLSLGRQGRKIIILDLDLRRPSQHRFADVTRDIGASDLMVGNATIEQVLHPLAPNVSVIAGGGVPPNPTELLDSQRFGQIIADLTARCDCLLIDAPPVLGLADAIIIGNRVEQVVYLIESGRNHTRGVVEALKRLRSAHVRIAGGILSRFDPGRSGYSYDYSYTYQYRYEK